MIDKLKKVFKGIKFKKDPYSFRHEVDYNGVKFQIDDIDLIFKPITKTIGTGEFEEKECECCGNVEKREIFKTLVETKVKDLSEEQKEEQLQKTVTIIKEITN